MTYYDPKYFTEAPRHLNAVTRKTHREIAGELAQQIKDLIHTQSGRIPLALVIGVLRIVEKELMDESE